MTWQTADRGWNPYLAGALLGILATLSVAATTHWLGKPSYLGASTTFVRAAGMIEQTVAPEHVARNEYYTKTKVAMDWQFMLVAGIFVGALAASLMDRSFKWEAVPPTWNKRFGPSVGKRAVAALGGGVVAMVGARLADGCPSGHGLSGMMQLSVSSFFSLILFFAAAIILARIVYGRAP